MHIPVDCISCFFNIIILTKELIIQLADTNLIDKTLYWLHNKKNKHGVCLYRHTWAPIPETAPMVSSQAQNQDANGPHLGPAKWAAQK
jgi:hypothetical protein